MEPNTSAIYSYKRRDQCRSTPGVRQEGGGGRGGVSWGGSGGGVSGTQVPQ